MRPGRYVPIACGGVNNVLRANPRKGAAPRDHGRRDSACLLQCQCELLALQPVARNGRTSEIHHRRQAGPSRSRPRYAALRVEQSLDAANDPGWRWRSGGEAPRASVRGPGHRYNRRSGRGDRSRRITASTLAARASTIKGAGGVLFGGSEVQQRFQTRSEGGHARLSPPYYAAASATRSRSRCSADVEGGEEAGFFVGEVLVEGGAGDAGPFDHVLNVGFATSCGSGSWT